jgi:hypothetical protein
MQARRLRYMGIFFSRNHLISSLVTNDINWLESNLSGLDNIKAKKAESVRSANSAFLALI